MAAWNVTDITNEIDSICQLLQVRFAASPLAGQEQAKRLETSLVTGLINKITSIVVDAQAAASLYDKVTKSSMSDIAKAEVVACIDSNISTARRDTAQTSFVKPQSFTHFVNYLTSKDWEVIDDAKSTVFEWIHVIITRLRRCNVKSAREDTWKWAVAVLSHRWLQKYGNLPKYSIMYEWGQQLRETFQSAESFSNSNVPLPLVYPEKPTELGSAFMSSAYDSGDPPICKDLPHLAHIARSHTPGRSTSKLLKKDEPEAATQNQELINTLRNLGEAMAGNKPPSGLEFNPPKKKDFAASLSASLAACLPNTGLPVPEAKPPSAPRVTHDAASLAALLQPLTIGPENSGFAAAGVVSGEAPPAAPTGSSLLGTGTVPPSADVNSDLKPPLSIKDTPTTCRHRIIGKRTIACGARTAEDFEQQAFKRLKTAQAAAKASAKAGKTAKTQAAAISAYTGPGCGKCRGSSSGCGQCNNPKYTGHRFNGKAAYEKWFQEKHGRAPK